MTKLIPTLLLLIVLLAACGAGDAVDSPDEAPAEAVVETGAGEPLEEEAAVVETAVVPQVEIVATAAVVTEEPLPPTEEVPPTAVPQPSEAPPADGAGWGESGTTAQSACDHPYFPLRSGMTWSMVSGDGEHIVWTVGEVAGDLETATAELTMQTAGLEFSYTWECSAESGLASYSFANQVFTALGPEVDIEFVEGSGYFLPDPAKLETGYTWDTNTHTVYSMTQLADDLEMEISGEMDTLQSSAVVSTEPVLYQGQPVPGLLIQQDTQIDTKMTMLGENVESAMFMGAEIEFGRGLGMLRQTTYTEFGDFTVEVTDIYVP